MKQLFFVLLLSIFSITVQAEEQKDFPNNYAVVWSLEKSDEKKKLLTDNLADQASAILALWKSGRIENVYMNNEDSGESEENEKSNFIFFIKAENEGEADEVLAELPFVKLGVASYKLHKVGLLWLKQYEDKSEESK